MIKELTTQELMRLINQESELCVSIYMPLYKSVADVRQNRVRFKNLIEEAVAQFTSAGASLSNEREISRLKENLLHSELFWEGQFGTFVAYISNKLFECYRLDLVVEEQIIAGEHFYIIPLLSLLNEDSKFYVMALSKNRVKLLDCDSSTYKEMALEGVPKNLEEANRFNDPERVLQLHTNTPRTPGSRAAAIFHGHGVGIDDEKDDLVEYFRQIDKGIHSLLKDEKAPLILATVDYLHPIYKKVSSYSHLLDGFIAGNPDLLRNHEIYERAKNIVSPYVDRPLAEALARYDQYGGTNRVSSNIETILDAAKEGKVWHLFVQKGINWYGVYDSKTGKVITHDKQESGDEEILNLSAIYSILNGGNVFLINRDTSKPSVFSVFRY